MDEPGQAADVLSRALSLQGDAEAHDRGLIVERLAWTPEQRLEAKRGFSAVLPGGTSRWPADR
jgi:hypothetical protein